ncbi:MAG: TonB-dependent receptor [Bacteroidia bacterium]
MKKYNFILISTIILLLAPTHIYSQSYGVLKGTIIDIGNKEAITGANIYDAIDFTRGTVSDASGNYELRLNLGKHKMICSFIGMKADTFYVFIDSLKAAEYNVLLKPAETQLHTMVISAGKYEQPLEDITVSMEVIKPTLIENKNTRNIKSALDQVPGLNILDGEPQIRGGSGFSFGVGSRVALLIDGLPALAGHSGRPEWNFIPVENIEQVEIIKGASSVTYGSSALSGSINVRTMYPKDTPETKVNIYSGIYSSPSVDSAKWWKGVANFSGANFVHSQKFKQIDFVIGGMGIYDHGFIGPSSYHPYLGNINDTISEKQVGEKTGRLNFNLRYRPKNYTNLNYGINSNFMQSSNNFSLIWDNDTSGIYRAFPKTMTLQNQTIFYLDPFINYYTKGGLNHSLRTRYYYSKNELTNNQSNESNVLYSEYQFNKKLSIVENLNITGGLVMNQTIVHGALFNNGNSTDNRLQNYAAYTQLDKKIWNVLNASLGFRGEYFKMNNEEMVVKPILRSGLNLKLSPATFLRYSYGQGYRYPTVTEKFIRTNTGGLNIFPNPALQAETSWSTEVGLKQGFKINNFLGFIDVAAFWQEYKNTIEFSYGLWERDLKDTTSYHPGFKYINTGNTRVRGIELSIMGGGNISKNISINIIGGYTYALPQSINPKEVYIKDAQGNPMSYFYTRTDTTDTKNILKYRYQHIAKADFQLNYKLFSIGGSWHYYSYMKQIDQTFYSLDHLLGFGIKKYREKHRADTHIFDARVGAALSKKIKVSLAVNNLLNLSYSLRPLKIESPRTIALQLSIKV